MTKRQNKEDRKKKEIELNRAGKTQVEIADILGISIMTVYTDFKEMEEQGIYIIKQKSGRRKGIKDKKSHTQLDRDTRLPKEIELNKAGKTQTEIAELLGLATSTVHKDLKKLREQGIEIQKQKRTKKINTQINERQQREIELNQEYKTRSEIAEILNIHETTVGKDYKQLRSRGVNIQRQTKRK